MGTEHEAMIEVRLNQLTAESIKRRKGLTWGTLLNDDGFTFDRCYGNIPDNSLGSICQGYRGRVQSGEIESWAIIPAELIREVWKKIKTRGLSSYAFYVKV